MRRARGTLPMEKERCWANYAIARRVICARIIACLHNWCCIRLSLGEGESARCEQPCDPDLGHSTSCWWLAGIQRRVRELGRSIEGAQNGMTQLQSIKASSSRPFSLAFCIVRAFLCVHNILCGHILWPRAFNVALYAQHYTYSIDKSAYGGEWPASLLCCAPLSLSAFCCEFHVPFVAMLCVEDENRSYHVRTSSFGRGLYVKSPRAPFCNTSCGRKNRFLAVWRTSLPADFVCLTASYNLRSSAWNELLTIISPLVLLYRWGDALKCPRYSLLSFKNLKHKCNSQSTNSNPLCQRRHISINSPICLYLPFTKTRQPQAMKQR